MRQDTYDGRRASKAETLRRDFERSVKTQPTTVPVTARSPLL